MDLEVHKRELSYGLQYDQQGIDSDILEGYVNADYAADCDRRRSLSGFVFTYLGNLVSWKTSLQPVVALSTTESEYIAATDAIKEGIWLKELASELMCCDKVVKVLCDSQSAVCLSKNQTYHDRTKHIDVQYHFIKDVLSDGEFKLEKISTDDNPADAFTKALPAGKFDNSQDFLSLIKRESKVTHL